MIDSKDKSRTAVWRAQRKNRSNLEQDGILRGRVGRINHLIVVMCVNCTESFWMAQNDLAKCTKKTKAMRYDYLL